MHLPHLHFGSTCPSPALELAEQGWKAVFHLFHTETSFGPSQPTWEPMGRINVWRMGVVAYQDAMLAMEKMAILRAADDEGDALLVCAHPPTFTLGKRARREHVKLSEEELAAHGIGVYQVPRGGQVTYHGPGQAVLYPVVSLRALQVGARRWIEGLEDTMVETSRAFGVNAHGRVPGASGAWVGNKKIGAVGVRISRGVSTYGLAYNVDTDLSAYDSLVACGFQENVATSLAHELGPDADLSCATNVLVTSFLNHFHYTANDMEPRLKKKLLPRFTDIGTTTSQFPVRREAG